jgi:ABC-type lipoprotein release transport system permease subunit
LLVGVAAGIVMATMAGARRTDSAYERFLVEQHADDVLIPSGGSVFGFADLDVDDVAALPQVAEEARFVYYQIGLPGAPDSGDLSADEIAFFSDRNDRIGTEIDRIKILEGRRPDPDEPFELAIGFLAAERYDLEVGDQVELSFFADGTDFLTGAAAPAEVFTFDIVGIEAAPHEFPPIADQTVPFVHSSPAFDRRFRGELLSIDGIAVRLHRGAEDVPAFKRAVEDLAGGQTVLFFDQNEQARGVQRSIHVQVQALVLLGTLLMIVAVLVVGQLIVRQILLEAGDAATMRAIGASRAQLVLLTGARAGLVAIAGLVLGIGLAVLLSPLAPVGLAERAEPDPGLAVDGFVFGIGILATFVFVVGAAAATTWWSTRRAPGRTVTVPSRRMSRVAGALSRASAPLPAVHGVRMALAAGGGRTAVPIRTTLFGATLAIVTVVGAVGFSASLDNLLDDPRLYGVAWDAEFGGEFGEGVTDEEIARLVDDPAIAGLAFGTTAEVQIDDRVRVPALAVDVEKPSLEPTVVEGRAPLAPDEILLGTKTMSSLDAEVGDRVPVAIGGRERAMRIVGRGVLPVIGDGGLGRGAFLTFGGLRELTPDAVPNVGLARFADGADGSAIVRALSTTFTEGAVLTDEAPLPQDIVNFGRVDNMPSLMALLMALLAVAALGHALFTAVRRRRVDLAILKTLGFSRGQLRATVAWQASVLALLAVVVGVPLGIVAGRWAWRVFADGLGVVYEPVVPVLLLLAIVPAALLLANVVAAVPGYLAARTKPATVLRSE